RHREGDHKRLVGALLLARRTRSRHRVIRAKPQIVGDALDARADGRFGRARLHVGRNGNLATAIVTLNRRWAGGALESHELIERNAAHRAVIATRDSARLRHRRSGHRHLRDTRFVNAELLAGADVYFILLAAFDIIGDLLAADQIAQSTREQRRADAEFASQV